MARLTASFALSAVLVLATGICSVTGQSCQSAPTTTLPFSLSNLLPMRIISRGNAPDGSQLSIAARIGDAILDGSDCVDGGQVWFKRDIIGGTFLLFNQIRNSTTQEFRAMQIPGPGEGDKVKLVTFDPTNSTSGSSMMLWKWSTTDGSYSKIQSDKNEDLFLDALLFGQPLEEGRYIGAYAETDPNGDNVYWIIKPFVSG